MTLRAPRMKMWLPLDAQPKWTVPKTQCVLTGSPPVTSRVARAWECRVSADGRLVRIDELSARTEIGTRGWPSAVEVSPCSSSTGRTSRSSMTMAPRPGSSDRGTAESQGVELSTAFNPTDPATARLERDLHGCHGNKDVPSLGGRNVPVHSGLSLSGYGGLLDFPLGASREGRIGGGCRWFDDR